MKEKLGPAAAAVLLLLGGAREQDVGDVYAARVGRIVGAALVEGQAFEVLEHLTDRIGPRLSGSPGAEAAVRFTREHLRAGGFEVRLEPVKVPRWVRGVESAEVVAPVRQVLVATALGGSIPTPEERITGEVVEAQGLEGVKALGEAAVRGKIVLYNRAMASADLTGYGKAVAQRTKGAVEAARAGAVAVLVRAVGTLSARLPHTGYTSYDQAVPKIPAAAVTAEDADLLHRLLARGDPVRVRLRLGCRTLPDADSFNVVADLRGGSVRKRSCSSRPTSIPGTWARGPSTTAPVSR